MKSTSRISEPLRAAVNHLSTMGAFGAARLDGALGYPYLRRRFRRRVGYALNLAEPRGHNEKIQWRKIHDRHPLYPVISDKLRLRDHVAGILGHKTAADLFVPLHLATDRPDEIGFDSLPGNLAIKANHASGWNLFLRAGDAVDHDAVRRTCRSWLRRKHGILRQEWAYWEIPPRIVVEDLLLTDDGRLADDIKFSIFDGECRFVQMERDRFGRYEQLFHDRDWRPLDMQMKFDAEPVAAPRPPQFELMRDLAETLGQGFDYIRVDFLFSGSRFALNELTLYRGSGFNPFHPRSLDFEFGAIWCHRPFGTRSSEAIG